MLSVNRDVEISHDDSGNVSGKEMQEPGVEVVKEKRSGARRSVDDSHLKVGGRVDTDGVYFK